MNPDAATPLHSPNDGLKHSPRISLKSGAVILALILALFIGAVQWYASGQDSVTVAKTSADTTAATNPDYKQQDNSALAGLPDATTPADDAQEPASGEEGEGSSDVAGSGAGSPSTTAAGGGADGDKATVYVHVIGAVKKPGIYQLAPGSRVHQLIHLAGGLTSAAAAESINLAQELEDGAQIKVLTRTEYAALSADGSQPAVGSPSHSSAGNSSRNSGKGQQSSQRINVNRADAATLEQIPGIGPVTAAKIVEHRNAHGPFRQPEDLTAVKGIGPATVEKFREHITCGP